jgi:uroporphyrinogen-III synthase
MSHGEAGALAGKRVVVTRARSQASELCRMIEELGGVPVEFPVIAIEPPESWTDVDRAIRELERFDWVMFTSVNGVDMFLSRVRELQVELAEVSARLAAVGPKTAAALRRAGLAVETVAEEFVAEGLLQALEGRVFPGQSVLLPRGDLARKALPEALRAIGCEVTEVVVYRNLMVADDVDGLVGDLEAGRIDFVTFTSSSTVKNFFKALKGRDVIRLLQGVKVAAIGPVTEKTAVECGLRVDVVPIEYTIPALVAALAATAKAEQEDE